MDEVEELIKIFENAVDVRIIPRSESIQSLTSEQINTIINCLKAVQEVRAILKEVAH